MSRTIPILRAARLVAIALLAVPAPATAISVDALFFDGPFGFGFSAGSVTPLAMARVIGSEDEWVLAGGPGSFEGGGLLVSNQLSAIHSNPQAGGRTPSAVDPLVADSTWTVTNQTGQRIPDGFLLFTRIDLDRRYPGLVAGLDGALLEILEYSSDDTDYFFGGVRLPSLGVGESFDLTVRYVVAGAVDYDAETNAYLLPRLGVAGLVVPEPITLSALALGLAALAAGRARRRS
jgi:hypothetical protein